MTSIEKILCVSVDFLYFNRQILCKSVCQNIKNQLKCTESFLSKYEQSKNVKMGSNNTKANSLFFLRNLWGRIHGAAYVDLSIEGSFLMNSDTSRWKYARSKTSDWA